MTYRLFRRKHPFFHECFADREEVRIIDSEHLNRDPADGRAAGEFGRPPLEMPTPLVLPWMEQPNKFASGRISSGDVWALVPVAVKAGQGKVVDDSWSTVLPRDDVIDVKRQGISGNRQPTVLATALRPLPDLGGAGPGSRMRLDRRLAPKCDPGLGLHDSEQISDMQIAVELRAFFIRQSARLGPVRQVLHTVAVSFPEADRQQIPGDFLGWIVSLRLHQSSPDMRFAVWTEEL